MVDVAEAPSKGHHGERIVWLSFGLDVFRSSRSKGGKLREVQNLCAF
jgi:hypothetical protein